MLKPTELVIALPAEARPLRRALALPRVQTHGDFPLYADGPLRLIVTGPGQRAAAEAVAWLAAQSPRRACQARWLNLGIAGHARAPLGQAYAIESLTGPDGHTQKTAPPTGLPRASLHSAEQPVNDYPEETLVDMEGAGFHRAASAIAPFEHIHLVKVVSDNRATPARGINGKRCEALVSSLLPWLQRWLTEAPA